MTGPKPPSWFSCLKWDWIPGLLILIWYLNHYTKLAPLLKIPLIGVVLACLLVPSWVGMTAHKEKSSSFGHSSLADFLAITGSLERNTFKRQQFLESIEIDFLQESLQNSQNRKLSFTLRWWVQIMATDCSWADCRSKAGRVHGLSVTKGGKIKWERVTAVVGGKEAENKP